MSVLNGVIKDAKPRPPKGILYGGPGVGKSTFGASIPDSITIDAEDGLGVICCTKTPYLKTWAGIREWLMDLAYEDHSYQAVVVDTLDWLLTRLNEAVSGAKSSSIAETLNKSHGGYGNGKQVLKNYISLELLPMLSAINERGMSVVLLAHAKRTDLTDVDGITTTKTTADIPDGLLPMFVEWADFLCLASIDANGQRIITTREMPGVLAKNRYGIAGPIAFDWPTFQAAVSNGLAAQFPKTENKKGE